MAEYLMAGVGPKERSLLVDVYAARQEVLQVCGLHTLLCVSLFQEKPQCLWRTELLPSLTQFLALVFGVHSAYVSECLDCVYTYESVLLWRLHCFDFDSQWCSLRDSN